MGFTGLGFETPVVGLFEATIFERSFSRRPSSAFVSRPVVADFGNPTEELREGAVADFGVSGWIEALSLGSAANLEEDGLEFWADAAPTIVPTRLTNRKAILYFIIENLQFGGCISLAYSITTHSRSSDCLKAINLWFRTCCGGFLCDG